MSRKAKIRIIRKFGVSFKKAIVKEFEKGSFSVGELCKLHDLHSTNVYEWIYKYSSISKQKISIVEMKESSTKKLKDYEEKIKELEQMLGRKQIKIDLLEKIIDSASDHYGEDIKKNSSMNQ